MTIYQSLFSVGERFAGKHTLFKWGFNLSPMYRTSTARIISVSPDLHHVSVRLPIGFRNRNYVGSIFGGSMFAAVDPIPMVQLINILDNDYVVWDKSAHIRFKAPAHEDLYADFSFSDDEIANIRQRVAEENEFEFVKSTQLTCYQRERTFCEVHKTIYVASKDFYRQKATARRG